MQVLANLASNSVVSTRSEGAVGDTQIVNGLYLLPVPEGVGLEVQPASYILPQDSGSLPYQAMAEFLSRYPMYDHISYNLFLEGADIAALDLGAGAPSPASGTVSPINPAWDLAGLEAGPNGPRCQVGRGSSPVGIAPGAVVILPANTLRTSGGTYGSLVTDTVDLTPFNPTTPGTEDVMVWWKIARFTLTEDIQGIYGATLDVNTPAIKSHLEVNQEPSDLFCYVSVDDGATWVQADYMTPTDLGADGTDLRVAFLNSGSTPIHLLGFAVMFQDLP